jgi:hypothetical protein
VSNVERLAGFLLVVYWLICIPVFLVFGLFIGYLFLLGLGALLGV